MHATHPKDVISLSRVIQAPGESLKDYLERFHTAVVEISNPNDHAISMVVIRGIDPESEFGDWLAGKPPVMLERFYVKVA